MIDPQHECTPYEVRQYFVGFLNTDGSRTGTEVEASSLYEAEEKAVAYRDQTVGIFAEECEEREEPDRPIVM